MADQKEPFDPIETMLHELDAATTAGVFRDTELDLNYSSVSAGTGRVVRRMLAAAAVVALVAGSWTIFYQLATGSRNPYAAVAASLDPCMGGPSQAILSADCAQQDRDSDSDFDLRDFSQVLASAARMP